MALKRKVSQMASAAAPQQSGAESWALAFRVLGELLAANDGVVSSMALRRELEGNHSIPNARDLVIELKFFDPEASVERGIPAPSFKFHHLGRSLNSSRRLYSKPSAIRGFRTGCG